MRFIARLLLLGAMLAATSSALAQSKVTPAIGWTSAEGVRPVPQGAWLKALGANAQADSRVRWVDFLSRLGVFPLKAPAHARAYRLLWTGEARNAPANIQGPSHIEVPQEGHIELVIDASGEALVRSAWHHDPVDVRGILPAMFEADLAQSDFATQPSEVAPTCADQCRHQIIEAIVDGEYYYVERDVRVVNNNLEDAVGLLERLAIIVGTRRDGNTSADACLVNSFGIEPVHAIQPTLVHCVAPAYPAAARQKGRQGFAMVSAAIRRDGSVTSAKVMSSSGSADLDSAARDAVSRWSFTPARDARGEAVGTTFAATIEFWKDSVDNVDQKSYADYVADARWFDRTERRTPAQTFLYIVLVERFAFEGQLKRQTEEEGEATGQRLRAALPGMKDKCAANPSGNFIATLRAAMGVPRDSAPR